MTFLLCIIIGLLGVIAFRPTFPTAEQIEADERIRERVRRGQ